MVEPQMAARWPTVRARGAYLMGTAEPMAFGKERAAEVEVEQPQSRSFHILSPLHNFDRAQLRHRLPPNYRLKRHRSA